MSFRRYYASDDAPWWRVVGGASDRLRYARAVRLSQFRRELARQSQLPHSAGWCERRERALAHWEEYLETGRV